MRIAFITSAAWADLSLDDRLAAAELTRRGAEVHPAVWDDPKIDWSTFDQAILRSCWDYHRRLPEFLSWLDRIEQMGIPLWNPPSLVRFNADKAYLGDLAAAGVPVVPTLRLERGAAADLATILDERGWTEAVVKPAVSASAFRTRRARREEAGSVQPDLTEMLAGSAVLIQPFLPEVQTRGEWSFLYFGGKYSHAVLKQPGEGDFRVQQELGGSAVPEAPDPRLLAQAWTVIERIPGPWLYARVDGIELDEGFTLMELELIEPSLFLAADPEAPGRFAEAVLGLQKGGTIP
jgi:glutathione synthase/RimK-type ligase-like ATP-grasp enzyme